MHKTEANIAHNHNVLITLGSSKVKGLHGAGAGFLIKGAIAVREDQVGIQTNRSSNADSLTWLGVAHLRR